MKYLYKCKNKNCKNYNKVIEIEKPISKSSNKEYCELCNSELQKVFIATPIKTNDNFKI